MIQFLCPCDWGLRGCWYVFNDMSMNLFLSSLFVLLSQGLAVWPKLALNL
jgi:hypothetical protein